MHANVFLVALMVLAVTLIGVSTQKPGSFPFNDPSLSWDERVADLVGRLTLDEITLQMANGGPHTHAPGIPRLGISPYAWDAECISGDVEAGPATSFPQALGLAATFSQEAVFNVSQATGIEVRAKFNNYSRHGDYGHHKGASCWSPVVNIMRDPRWGRNQETYGEDPYLSGSLAAAFVKGLQGAHPRYIRVNAGCKHFDVHGGPENIPTSRSSFNAEVLDRDWRMTFLPAFKACVEAGTYSLMCSYNKIRGIPACANKELLTDILRNEWGFRGYVVSDEGAIENMMKKHNYTHTKAETAAVSVNAGTNLEDGPNHVEPFYLAIPEAVKQGLLNESTVRESVKPLFYTRMRLGLFDPPAMNPYTKLEPSAVIQSEAHRRLSLETATRSFVLLKNSESFLPLKRGQTFGTVAILGPMADNVQGIFGDYAPTPEMKYTTTPLQGLRSLGNSTHYETGCEDTACLVYNQTAVKMATHAADLVIVCLGTGSVLECEGNDRSNISLPGRQLELLQDAANYAAGAPVLLLLFNAGPLDISWAVHDKRVQVILECFFPAQSTGEALRHIFYRDGPGSNPAGRLPATWPTSLDQYPPIVNYTMEGRTYRYSRTKPLFPFGFGLSYSKFVYRSLDVRPKVLRFTNRVLVDVYVENKGPYDGEEVVQVYVASSNRSLPAVPQRQLVGFQRVFIPNGKGASLRFTITVEQISTWNDKQRFVVLQGSYMVYVGGQQPDQAVTTGSNILTSQFTVV